MQYLLFDFKMAFYQLNDIFLVINNLLFSYHQQIILGFYLNLNRYHRHKHLIYHHHQNRFVMDYMFEDSYRYGLIFSHSHNHYRIHI